MNEDQRPSNNVLLCTLSIFVASSMLFLDGFFQVSQNQIAKSGHQHYDNVQPNILDNYKLQTPTPKIDQIILMIIDAWRIDYPNATNMPYTYEHACDFYDTKVNIPTVTMPRLKSITTGTVSNFIDIVLNLGHAAKLDDSLLHRLEDKKKNSVFAGDQTWTQLFPNKFLRANPNRDSLFVNDFYEGDLNVTKTLKKELQSSDWHLMILHYLGLDHIGHVEGSHTEKVYTKLLEMDNVVKDIATNISSRQLLLLTADHGMRNGGSHGGTDTEELHVPLIELKKKCYKSKWSTNKYNQIDIAATLAVLLDVKIPHTSIGCLIPEMLEIYMVEEQLYLFYYNALHLLEKLKAKFDLEEIKNEDYYSWYKDAKANHKQFIDSHHTSYLAYENTKQNYLRCAQKISQILSESSVQFDMQQIYIALSLTTLYSIKLLVNALFKSNPIVNRFMWVKFSICLFAAGCINFFLCRIYVFNTKRIVRWIMFTFCISFIIYKALDLLKLISNLIILPLNRIREVKLKIPWVVLALFLCHTLSLASSSFIEEEHQTWYYLTSTLLTFLTLQNFYNEVKSVGQKNISIDVFSNAFLSIRSILLVMLSIIGCRRLNQTGDKWKDVVDIGDVLTRNENMVYLNLTLLLGLILLLFQLKKYNSSWELLFCSITLFCVFLYHQTENYSFLVLIFFWTSLVATQIRHCRYIFCKNKKFAYETKEFLVQLLGANLTFLVLLSALLHRPHNVILLPALIYTLEKSYYLCDNLFLKNKRLHSRFYVLVLKTTITSFIANMFYFFQGNSNSLATINVNSGFIGLSSYNPFIAGLQITLNTYCAPINAFLYLMWHMFFTQRNSLPLRDEKEEITNVQLMETTEDDLYLVYNLFTVSTIMPTAFYWCLLVGFRHHLFIYSVFAPKAFYEFFHLLVFYINFIITNLYLRLFLK